MTNKKTKITIKKTNILQQSLGWVIITIGALLFLTIIGILPGIGIMTVGASLLMRNVKCPNCDNNLTISQHKPSIKCKTCDELIFIERE